jgi:hypothetical protein
MGFAPLAFLPGGKAAGQAGKVAVKQIARYAGKEVAEEAAKKLTRRELVTFASFLEGRALKPQVEARLIDKLQRLGIGSIDKGMERAFRIGNVHEMFKGSNFPKHPDISFMNGRLNIEIKVAETKRELRSMKKDLKKAVAQLRPNQAATLDNKGHAIPIPEDARNIIYLDYRKATLLISKSKMRAVAKDIMKENPHISEVIIHTKNGAIRVPPQAKSIKSLSNVPSGLARIDSVARPTQSYVPISVGFPNSFRGSTIYKGHERNKNCTSIVSKTSASNKSLHCAISYRKLAAKMR